MSLPEKQRVISTVRDLVSPLPINQTFKGHRSGKSAEFINVNIPVRHIRSIGRPLEFQLMEEAMRNDFSRIRSKCETLLAQRVDELVKEIGGTLPFMISFHFAG